MRSPVKLWVGRAITALPILFLLFDGVIKLMNIPPVVESFARLGYRTNIALAIGLLELALVAIYLFARTAIAGAVLLTRACAR